MSAILSERSADYSTVRRQVLLYRRRTDPPTEAEDWRLMYGLVTAVSSGRATPSAVNLKYDDFIYDEQYLSIVDGIKWLGELVLKGTIVVADKVGSLDTQYPFSHQYDTRGYQRHVNYPCDWFQTKVSQVHGWIDRPLHGASVPTYPDFNALVHHRFGIEEHSQSWMGEFHILLPAYALKIDGISVRKKKVIVKVLLNAKDASDYEVRLWARSKKEHFDLRSTVRSELVEFRLPKVPTHLAALLVKVRSGEVVDRKGDSRSVLKSPEKPKSATQWKRRIQEGEDQDLEFKNFEVHKSGSRISIAKNVSAEQIARELVAFANSGGGTLLIGVGDDRVVCGVDDVKETRARILAAASNNCEPPISPKLFKLRIQNMDVVGVEVEPGTSIHQTGQRVYVRKGETTRPAHPTEIPKILEAGRLGKQRWPGSLWGGQHWSPFS